MTNLIFKCLALIFFVANFSACIRPLERHSHLFENPKPHSIKIVSYAIKTNEAIEIKTVPVRNLAIEPFKDWVAKGLFTGDNYNTTGY